MYTELLKTTLNNPELLDLIPHEALTPLESQFYVEYKKQLETLERPTLKSISRQILTRLKPEQHTEFKTWVNSMITSEELDDASVRLDIYAMRGQAIIHVAKQLVALHSMEAKPQDIKQLQQRIVDLQEPLADPYPQPVNALEWDKLVKEEQEAMMLNIDWFIDNDVPIKKKVLYCLIATTNGGKTIIKTWIAVQLMKIGKNVLYLAQEEPYWDTIRRVYQACLNITEAEYNEMTKDSFESVGTQFAKLAEAQGFGKFDVAEWPGIAIDTLTKKLEKMNQQNQLPDAIIIDYGKLVQTKSKVQAEWERIGKVFEELKTLAMKMNIAVITSIQLNREASAKLIENGRTPDVTDVAGAYDAMTHTNYVWSVRLQHQESRDEVEHSGSIRGLYTLTVQKSKYGRLDKGSSMNFQWTADHNLVQTRPPVAGEVSLPDGMGFDT